MDEDELSIFDVESAILTGEIIERQKEQTSREWKYVLHGEAVEGDALIVVAKVGPTRKLIIITVYRSWEKVMVCDICGKSGARVRRVTRSYGKGKNLFVIENIPVVTCPHCGESYLTAETLHEIERLKLHRRKIAQEHCIDVVPFA